MYLYIYIYIYICIYYPALTLGMQACPLSPSSPSLPLGTHPEIPHFWLAESPGSCSFCPFSSLAKAAILGRFLLQTGGSSRLLELRDAPQSALESGRGLREDPRAPGNLPWGRSRWRNLQLRFRPPGKNDICPVIDSLENQEREIKT